MHNTQARKRGWSGQLSIFNSLEVHLFDSFGSQCAKIAFNVVTMVLHRQEIISLYMYELGQYSYQLLRLCSLWFINWWTLHGLELFNVVLWGGGNDLQIPDVVAITLHGICISSKSKNARVQDYPCHVQL